MFLTSRLQNNLNVKHEHYLTLNSIRKDTHDRDLIGVTRNIDDHDYIWNWLFHLKIEKVKTFEKDKKTSWSRLYFADTENKFLMSRVDLCSTFDPTERPIRSLFFCKLWTTITRSKMSQIDDVVTYLKAQDVSNYVAVTKIYNVQSTTLRRRFLGLSTSRTTTSIKHHQLFNTVQKNVLLNYIDRMTTRHILSISQIV